MATYLTSGNDGYTADGGEVVHALEGNDQIYVVHVDDSSGFNGYDFDYFAPSDIYGNQGDDYIASYSFADRLYGDSGDDTLVGGGGDDLLKGGANNDTIYTGTSGDDDDIENGDTVWAGTGDDTVYLQGAHHGDTVRGEDGYDILKLFNGGNHITQFSLAAGGSNGGLYASGFEELEYHGGSITEVIEGGANGDMIFGLGGGDIIAGLDGGDTIYGGDGADIASGGAGDDWLHGGNDNDVLSGLDGDDHVNGNDGNDDLRDGTGADQVTGGDGDDLIRTGTGNDVVAGGDDNDVIREEGSDIQTIVVNGQLVTRVGGDHLSGDGGDDDIRGASGHDTIDGGLGNDTIDGGAGVDGLAGGSGNDIFDYDAITDSGQGETRDTIGDFQTAASPRTPYADHIDLSTIDARAGVAGNQAFSFVGDAGFSGEGQIRVVQQGADAAVQLNTSGNGGIEMAILLLDADASQLSAADFIL